MLPVLTALLTVLTSALGAARDPARAPSHQPQLLRASYLICVTDDFIVDVYLNGRPVPDEKRNLLEERFGATVERIDVAVHRGDWLVFNVVNNRLRWGGTRYFGVAGCFAPDEFGFVSDRASRQWSACDEARDAGRFISQKGFLSRRSVQLIENPWLDGDGLMRQHAGEHWSGSPVWGGGRNTWIKVILE